MAEERVGGELKGGGGKEQETWIWRYLTLMKGAAEGRGGE